VGKAAALLALALAGLAPAAQAQTTQVLVENRRPSTISADNVTFWYNDFATEFTTGNDPGGYALQSVDVFISKSSWDSKVKYWVPGKRGPQADVFPFRAVRIRESLGNASYPSDSVLIELTPPSTYVINAFHTFTVPTNRTVWLRPNQRYFVDVEVYGLGGGHGILQPGLISNNSQSGLPNWSIANSGWERPNWLLRQRWRPKGTWKYGTKDKLGRSGIFRIKGYPIKVTEAPTGFTTTAGNRRATLSWDNPGNSDITKYQYRQGSGSWTDIANSDADTTSHVVTGLTNDVTYSFQVRAVAETVHGPSSNSSGDTPGFSPPTGPRLKAAAEQRRVILTWDNPGNSNTPSTSTARGLR